ncbi:MAG: AI-2E family transporter [Candidatus Shapirobacteria bacterium]|nr:AI-2E family transporter [Candidatus Shapirobacteria bacterium]
MKWKRKSLFGTLKLMPRKIEISHRTIIFTIFFLDRLARWRIPRFLSILFIYFLILAIVGFAIAGIIPPLIAQTQVLISRFPSYIENLKVFKIDEQIINNQLSQIGTIAGGVFRTFIGFFQSLFNLLILLVISFYLLLQRKDLGKYLLRFFGPDGEAMGLRIFDQIEKRLGGWVRVEFLLMITIGLLCYIGLRLIGIDLALPLAIFAGLMEIISNIGPIISAIPAILVGLIISPLTALAVVALFFLMHQLENSLIAPQIMSREVGINPLITIIALISGFTLGGVIGGVLAVPVVLLLEIIFTEITTSERFKNLDHKKT